MAEIRPVPPSRLMNPDGTSDKNLVNLDGNGEPGARRVHHFETIDASGEGFTAGLKISGKAHDVDAIVERIVGGSENCVDLNNECSGVTVYCGNFEARGKYAISAKTCRDVTISGHITGRASDWEINLGSWSDQSSQSQDGTHLALTADVYPVRVWLGNARNTSFDDASKYKVVFQVPFGEAGRALFMFGWAILKRLKLA